ncbi:carboxylesterase [Anaerosporomusa subterranea]|uniref:Carboxylesterase n=1 Tax=Anaerosporomusa subterranea TaxID=1794912 RepID=A0A154BPX9_ANASB|nr:alpha/beta fold hydrolase [Anaerosporomusa subterranea]KYZ75558.1 carboxylesterase [Anaerosporomusa subterranea]
MAILKGAEPFLYRGDSHGVLLPHGFTGSPSEMRLLGEFLHRQGYTVYGPRLPGHGTHHQDMEKTEWRQWYGAVEDGFHILKGICKEVSVVGLSMGGILALLLASEYPVKRVVSLSAPIYIADQRLKWLNVYRMFRRYAPKRRRKLDVSPEYYVGYDRTPLRNLSSLLELIQHVKNRLAQLQTPLLVVQSRAEHTVRPESADYIYQHAGSREKELFWLQKSGHIVTLDAEKEIVFKKVAAFLEKPFGDVR